MKKIILIIFFTFILAFLIDICVNYGRQLYFEDLIAQEYLKLLK